MRVLVSVIVPLYHVQDYVGNCIQSLRVQTCKNFEVICIDDCSDDHSAEVAEKAAHGDSRFRFLRMPRNSGVSAVRNEGIRQAQGDYLMFVDSDDMLRGDAIEKASTLALEDDLDDVFYTASACYESDEVASIHSEDTIHRSDCSKVMTGPQLFMWFRNHHEFWAPAQFHMVRRRFILDHNLFFYEGILHEDELYTAQTLAHAKRATYLNEELYIRRFRHDSIMTTKKSIRNIAGVFRVTQEMQKFIFENADRYEDDFVESYTQRITFLRDLAAHDARELPLEDLQEYAETLPLDDRIDFDMFIIENSLNITKIYGEITDSLTFQVGQALVTVPALIRNAIERR
jgi:glycosyltransferase involved in cell wall biosynthesis